MTFAQFQATGRDVADLSTIPQIEAQGIDCVAGRVYDGELFIEGREGRWDLTIGNRSDRYFTLEAAEQVLYQFAVDEQYFTNEGT